MLRGGLALFVVLAACAKPPPPPYVRTHVDQDPGAPCVHWSDRAVTWRVDPALSARTPGDGEHAAVQAAFASWGAVAASCSDLTLTEDAGSQNLVVWRETDCATAVPPNDACHSRGDCALAFSCWDFGAETIAVTLVTYSRSTGRLLDADIELNGAGWLFTTVDAPPCAKEAPAADCVATDVQNTVTHELGHLLGLEHSEAPGSTMAATAGIGDLSKRAIDDGTRDGLCAIYPRGAPTPECEGAD